MESEEKGRQLMSEWHALLFRLARGLLKGEVHRGKAGVQRPPRFF
jgi:hypothetical protein